MWLVLGLGAVVTALANVTFTARNKRKLWLAYASISLTALTVCAFYSDMAGLVLREEWSGLMDIVPPVSKMLWFLVAISILTNAFPFWMEHREKKELD